MYFRRILKYQISWKSFQWEPSHFRRTHRRTDTTKLLVAFRDFAKASKNIFVKICRGVAGWMHSKTETYQKLPTLTLRVNRSRHLPQATEY
jgi:hypothetical protein